ncbi:MAG: glycosyltransferase family 87 protein [Ferruginibacter sp.]|nr:DUF2029 domain-containing protein [Ferruginibacter sp.]
MQKVKQYLLKADFLKDYKLAILLWFGLVILAILLTILHNSGNNNFLIFRQVYFHTTAFKNLYTQYPLEYGDVNLYGPIFSIVIAPFALFSIFWGSFFWLLFLASVLFYAIMQLPINKNIKIAIIILNALEMMNVASYYQSNAFIAACILLGFVYINKGKDFWALFFILLATFIKIYGIVGLAFFFFSKNKAKFVLYFIFWSAVFFVLPMAISSYSFIIQCYKDWLAALTAKSIHNTDLNNTNNFQNISVMGMAQRIFSFADGNNIFIYLSAIFLFSTQYLQIKYYSDIRYRLYLLCSVLLFVVIFSTGSESSTYIIAFPAICLWYYLQPNTKVANIFFAFAFIITSLAGTDLVTPYVREHFIRAYALKALPAFITWLIICWQINTKQFLKVNLQKTEFSK